MPCLARKAEENISNACLPPVPPSPPLSLSLSPSLLRELLCAAFHPIHQQLTLLHATSPILVTTIRAVLAPGAHPDLPVEGSQLRASKAEEEGEEVKEDADRNADEDACSGACPTNACAASAAKKSSDNPAEAFMIPSLCFSERGLLHVLVCGGVALRMVHDTDYHRNPLPGSGDVFRGFSYQQIQRDPVFNRKISLCQPHLPSVME